MRTLKVGLLQMVSHGWDVAANRAKGEEFCRMAAEMGADIALFPEMWSVGYRPFDAKAPGARQQFYALAIGADDPFVQHFRQLAAELRMAIALTYLERWDGAPRNTVSLIDRHGNVALTYAKVHTCDFGFEAATTPGEEFPVCELDTAAGPVKIGAMICYDREFPETARILMLQGAEILLTPNACRLEDLRLSQYKTRAYENMVGMAMTNYAAPQNNGHSVAFDAVAYDRPDGPTLDTCLVEADEGEGLWIAEFDLDRLRAYRAREAWGNAYRKPRLYGLITSEDVHPPFIRPDARR